MRRRIARWTFRLVLMGFVLWLSAGAWGSWKLTRRPYPPFAEPPPTIAGREMQQLRFLTTDGEQIGAWYLPGGSGRGTIVFLHGIGGSRSKFRNLFEPLSRDGRGVLAVSHRCHGDSTGNAHDAGYSARHDVIAAVEFLERESPAERIVLCGSSFGAAAAAYASGELGPRVHGYVFESLYPDLRAALWNRLDCYLLPGADYLAYAGMRLWAPAFLATDLDKFRPGEAVKRIPERIPLLFAVGSRDVLSTPAESQTMYQAVKSHAKLVEFPAAEHSLLHANNPTLYLRILTDLLERGAWDQSHSTARTPPQ